MTADRILGIETSCDETAAAVVEDANSESRDRKESVGALDRFLDARKVPDELRGGIRAYFLFLHDRLHTERYRAIFAMLPPHLRRQLHAGAPVG